MLVLKRAKWIIGGAYATNAIHILLKSFSYTIKQAFFLGKSTSSSIIGDLDIRIATMISDIIVPESMSKILFERIGPLRHILDRVAAFLAEADDQRGLSESQTKHAACFNGTQCRGTGTSQNVIDDRCWDYSGFCRRILGKKNVGDDAAGVKVTPTYIAPHCIEFMSCKVTRQHHLNRKH